MTLFSKTHSPLQVLTNTQKNAIEKLSKLYCGALFMKMGTGKTRVALELIKSKLAYIECVIWIAPASLLSTKNYHNEIDKWLDFQIPFHFFSIEGISQSKYSYIDLYQLSMQKKSFCVIDESITIKNTDAGRTKRLLYIANNFTFRLILNGTACTKGLYDIYSQMQFLSPKILNMTEAQFASNFLTYKNEGYKPWKRWSKPENEAALIEIIRPYIFDCDLEIEANLFEENVFCPLSEKEKEKYNDFKYSFLKRNIGLEFLEVAQAFQQFYSLCGIKKQKLDALVKEITAKNEKAVIFCKYLSEIEYLKKYTPIVFTGKEKHDLSNIKNNSLLVCTYGVGSFGLNLQEINNVIYVSQTFDFMQKEQSKHRVYRKGQNKDVTVYNFWCDTGLEEIIKKSLKKKENTLKNIEEYIKNSTLQEL